MIWPERLRIGSLGSYVLVVDHKCPLHPREALHQHAVVHRCRDLRADGARAVLANDIRRNTHVPQENGGRADLLSLLKLALVHRPFDRVHQLAIAIEQHTAIDHA